jgi:NAD(P)H-dependent flavin oxidoreductase YrpB (nitropropane dioxygenase family)
MPLKIVVQRKTNKRKQVWTAGQVIGLIHDIPTCGELLARIEKEAVEATQRTQSLYTATPQSKL